jgi:hypothetical protein
MARAVQTAIDSLNFFVESRNAGNIIPAVQTTAAGGATSADQTNTAQRGAMFFIAGVSVTVNSGTINLNINAKDVVSGTYFPYLTIPVIVTAGATQSVVVIYAGAVSGTFFNANDILVNMPLPNVFQVITSLVVSTSASMSGTLTYSVDYSKVM